mmetsp:Transcript_28166/g.56658  ORF Transcript_28166/g.56658 Transcript_28166/m.56658 type:complete len:305 (-) Transcript_28166:1705-2619(-)
MKWLHHLFILSVATSTPQATAAFINSRRGTNANPNNQQIQQQQQQTAVVSTAADAALAINSIKFMNTLCGRKNTADVRTFTQSITSSMGNTNNVHVQTKNDSCIEKRNASRDDDDETLWTLLNVFFRNEEQQDCPEIISPEENSDPNSSSSLHNKSNTSLPQSTSTHETVAEYIGKLWFLPKDKGTIKFRETIRIISLGLNGETSTVECHTQYYNGSEWVDCSKVLCHFTSLSTNYQQVRTDMINDDGDAASPASLQQKVKMTLDCELLVWLPLPSVASKAVQKKISSVFEEIVAEFFDELAMA